MCLLHVDKSIQNKLKINIKFIEIRKIGGPVDLHHLSGFIPTNVHASSQGLVF